MSIIAKTEGAMTQNALLPTSALLSHLSSITNHEIRLKNLDHEIQVQDIILI